MRTKTLALSTLLGALGTASSLVAQTNVYSVNAVGYINVSLPPGYSVFTCPLICSPNNQLNTLFPPPASLPPNTPAPLYNLDMTVFSGGHFGIGDSISYSGGWNNGGTITVNPGQAVWANNPNHIGGASMNVTIVGTVPQNGQYNMTNTLIPGYNLVGSIVPVTGTFASSIINLTNSIGADDEVLYFNPPTQTFASGTSGSYSQGWFDTHGNNVAPSSTNVTEGFYYYNATAAIAAIQGADGPQSSIGLVSASNEFWVESFTINP
jgi:hypothetical protein